MDIYPTKAQFLRGEEASLRLETCGAAVLKVVIRLSRLGETVRELRLHDVTADTNIPLGSFDESFASYGVDARVETEGGSFELHTAFDVTDEPRRCLRYGFLSDFTREDAGNGAVDWLCKCHINMVQFYDWSYRHDSLVPPENDYTDMMGKILCLDTVMDKIRRCHERGMLAMAYGAVYAASREFFERHRSWAFYNSEQRPFVFIDVFYIMNIQRGSPWREHLIGQYKSALGVGFDGIHMDTYGFPKTAYSHLSAEPELVHLDEEFPSLIADARSALSSEGLEPCLVFNNVGNWPASATAKAPQDAVYIEVWPPYERYHHLSQLIREAKLCTKNEKPVILAAYLQPFRENDRRGAMTAAKLLTAAVVSNGASSLLTGESGAVLTQGYYSDYTKLTEDEARELRRYYDFQTRYGELFYSADMRDVSMTHMGWDNYEYRCLSHQVSADGEAGKLWAVLREGERRKCISLINLAGCDDHWNRAKPAPTPQREMTWSIQIDNMPKAAYAAAPERPEPLELELNYEVTDKGRFAELTVPEVKLWTVVWLEF
jgi:hypothetical protein